MSKTVIVIGDGIVGLACAYQLQRAGLATKVVVMGPRPTPPDYLPAIGRSARWSSVYYAFGHQHLGLTLAAVTAEIVRDLVTDVKPPLGILATCWTSSCELQVRPPWYCSAAIC